MRKKTGIRIGAALLAAAVFSGTFLSAMQAERVSVRAADGTLQLTKKAATKTTVTMRIKVTSQKKVKSYKIQMKKSGKWKTIEVKNTTKKSFSYKVSGLSAGTTYAFRVRAFKKKDCRVNLTRIETIQLKTTGVSNALTQANVQKRMLSLKKKFPEGMYWTNANGYSNKVAREFDGYTYDPGYFTGYGCAGFAMILQEYGENYRRATHQVMGSYKKLPKLRVGDVARVCQYGMEHSVVILEVAKDGHTVTVAEGNFNSSVHWGRELDLADRDTGFMYIDTFWD